ncbi:MAG: tetratricopeptide repeat protein [Acidobacteria bacterium]|nr:tetratricopeptide repeat protein [Acidobacteriota bacterium]
MRRISALVFLTAAFSFSALAETWLVIPFANQTSKPTLDWIGESIAESISESLVRRNFILIDREQRKEAETRLALRANTPWTRGTMLKIAEVLDADHLVFGIYDLAASSETTSLGTLKLNAEVINVRDLNREGKFEDRSSLEDLASLQSRLANRIAKTQPAGNAGVRLDALENYVRGLLASTPEAQERFFQQSLKLEPRYSQASFQYGRLLLNRGNNPSAALQLDKVQPEDPHYLEANFLLGLARFRLKEFKGAEAAFARVNREVPLGEVLNNLGVTQLRLVMPEAVETLRQALEGDSKDPIYHFNFGLALLLRGAFAEAADQFRAALESNPDDQDATKLLGRCLRPKSGIPPREDLYGSERLKLEYEESAWRQLKALTAPTKK